MERKTRSVQKEEKNLSHTREDDGNVEIRNEDRHTSDDTTEHQSQISMCRLANGVSADTDDDFRTRNETLNTNSYQLLAKFT